MWSRREVLVLLVVSLLWGRPVWSQSAYIWEVIDAPFAGAVETLITGINDAGEMVGHYLARTPFPTTTNDNVVGFLRTAPEAWELFPLYDIAGINASQTMLSPCALFGRRACLFHSDLGTLEPLSPFDQIVVFVGGINDFGQVVGGYQDEEGQFHLFAYWVGVYYKLDLPFANSFAQFTGTNNFGQSVGFYDDRFVGNLRFGFLRSGGVFGTITVPGATRTQPMDINERGQIVGIYETPKSDGTFERQSFLIDGARLDRLTLPGAISLEIYGINNRGQIVGRFFDVLGNGHGVLGTPTGLAVAGHE